MHVRKSQREHVQMTERPRDQGRPRKKESRCRDLGSATTGACPFLSHLLSHLLTDDLSSPSAEAHRRQAVDLLYYMVSSAFTRSLISHTCFPSPRAFSGQKVPLGDGRDGS